MTERVSDWSISKWLIVNLKINESSIFKEEGIGRLSRINLPRSKKKRWLFPVQVGRYRIWSGDKVILFKDSRCVINFFLQNWPFLLTFSTQRDLSLYTLTLVNLSYYRTLSGLDTLLINLGVNKDKKCFCNNCRSVLITEEKAQLVIYSYIEWIRMPVMEIIPIGMIASGRQLKGVWTKSVYTF